MGDGNMGAQNAFHELGPRIGITVGIIDASKGALVILIALPNSSIAYRCRRRFRP